MEALLGAFVLAAAVLVLLDGIARRRGRPLLKPPRTTSGARRAAMCALSIGAGLAILPALLPAMRQGTFSFCGVCPVSPSTAGEIMTAADFVRVVLLAAWYYAATVLPVFVLACLLSGALASRGNRFRVRGVWRSFGLAAVLPVCSCGTVPLGKAIIESGETGPRDGLVFLATAPLLSPVILALSFAVLGPTYAVLRVVASALVALAVAFVVRPFLDVARAGKSSCGACDAPPASEGVVLAGWSFLARLVRYALYGIALGALFTAALPPEYVSSIVRPGPLATAAAVVVGLPINMCAGEEILVSAPLVGAGFTMGHALAFALAGTGICMGSLPLLAAALGRRAVLALVAVYIVVPFVVGLVVDLLPWNPS